MTTARELHSGPPAGRQAAEHIATADAFGHFLDQAGHVRRARVGMYQRGMGLKAASHRPRPCGRQWRHAGKHPVLAMRQLAQHDGHGRLVEILGVVGCNAHAHRAAPVGDFWQLRADMVQDVLRVGRIAVSDVQQPQCGRRRVNGQSHVGAKLGQHQGRSHGPLGVGGVAVGEELHGRHRKRENRNITDHRAQGPARRNDMCIPAVC